MNTFSALSQLDRKDKAIKPTSKPRKQDKATITPSKGKKAKIGANIRNKSESPPLPPKQAIKQAIKTPPQAQQSDGSQSGGVVDRPVDQTKRLVLVKTAFYLSEETSDNIDEAVAFLKKKYRIKKMDRSTFLSALLDNPDVWTKPSLDNLVNRVVKYLTSRATGRLVD